MPAMLRVAPTVNGRMIRIVVFRICCVFSLVVGNGQVHSALEGPVDGTTAATVEPRYVVHTGTLLAEPDKPPLPRASLLIQGDHIVEVRPGHVAPADFAADAQLINLSSLFVLPGLIDSQVHFTGQLGDLGGLERDVTMTDPEIALRGSRYAKRTLEAGFTSVRDMGDGGEAMFALRDAIASGLTPGPRMQAAGRIIGPELGGAVLRPEVGSVVSPNASCSGAAACRDAVRQQILRGADTIKLYLNHDLMPATQPWFTDDELRAMVDAAHALGRKVTASAFAPEPIKAALRAGVDAVVHGVFLDDEAIQMLLRNDAYLISTLSAADTVGELALDKGTSLSAQWRTENLEIHRAMFDGFGKAHAAGVRIAFGTDAGWRAHGQNALQLGLMVDAGMTPSEAIASATVQAAGAIGWGERVGRLRPGFQADLIGVPGNPLQDVSVLRDVLFVMKAGRIYRWDKALGEAGARTVSSTSSPRPAFSGASSSP